MNIKNIRGHLPDLSYKDTEVVYYGIMSHSDVVLETIPKTPPWPQKHTNIKIDNDIKELCNNKHVA